MRIVKTDPSARKAAHNPIFEGRVETQHPLGEGGAVIFNEITFHDGAHNKLHAHTNEQILFVTAGEGIVATEHEEHAVVAGDIAIIPGHEPHWHGAKPGHDMTHWSLHLPGTTTIL
jgi:quercetin dioxygenase-like cupin family protein